MKTIKLQDMLAQIRKRKAELGIEDTPKRTEAMRNRGGNRTPEKREMLRRIDERCRKAGIEPLTAYY